MNSTDRVAFYENMLDTFLAKAKDGGYIVFAVAGRPDEYVQYRRSGDRIVGEVGSRQWTDPERPLPASAVDSLALLGFTGGGPERNFARHSVPDAKADLAQLTDRLFRAAYEPGDEFSPLLSALNLNDVTLPRAQPFTRDMIEARLRAKGLHYLRDENGDFQFDIACDGADEPVTVWMAVEGHAANIYRIFGGSRRRPLPATREEALERCNQWNREHRWATAVIEDAEHGWRVFAKTDADFAAGVTAPLFTDITDHAVLGILEFWTWIAEQSETADSPKREEQG